MTEMISKDRLYEMVQIEKKRILEEFKTKDSVWCDYYDSWGVIHSGLWIYKQNDLDWELYKITRETGFICFKSTPDFIDIIKAAVLIHFGIKNYNPVIS